MSKLLPGENLVLKDHPHWITVVKTLPIPIVLVILVLWTDFTVPLGNYVLLPIPNFRTFLALLPKPGDFRDQVFVQSEKRRGGAVPPVPSATPVPANPSGV